MKAINPVKNTMRREISCGRWKECRLKVMRGEGEGREQSLCGRAGALLLDVLEESIEQSTDLWDKELACIKQA
jgi:hypothetical protein